MEGGSFYVTLASNASCNIYPDNTIACFTNKLARPVNLSGAWEVAITEIQYPHSYNTFEQNEASFFAGTIDLKEYYVKPGYYSSISELLKVINAKLESVKISSEFIKLRYDDVERSVMITGSAAHNFIPGEKLAYVLGMERNLTPALVSKNVKTGLQHDAMKSKQTLDSFIQSEDPETILVISTKNPDKEITSKKYYPDIRAGFYTLFVYTDIITHQLVGDSYVQLLRTVEISGKNNDIITRGYTRPDYIPVCSQHFDSVSISILTDQSRPVKFKYGKCVVRLHFRPRKEVVH